MRKTQTYNPQTKYCAKILFIGESRKLESKQNSLCFVYNLVKNQ